MYPTVQFPREKIIYHNFKVLEKMGVEWNLMHLSYYTICNITICNMLHMRVAFPSRKAPFTKTNIKDEQVE